jgi:hypothetical protein
MGEGFTSSFQYFGGFVGSSLVQILRGFSARKISGGTIGLARA